MQVGGSNLPCALCPLTQCSMTGGNQKPWYVQPCLCAWVIKSLGIRPVVSVGNQNWVQPCLRLGNQRSWYVQPCLCDWVIKGLGMSSRVCVTG